VAGQCLRYSGYQAAFVATGIIPILGALLSWFVLRDTPNLVHDRRAVSVSMRKLLRTNRDAALLVGGYVFHNWELVGMWSWTPAFLAAAFALSGGDLGQTVHLGAYLAAAMHLVGSFASASMGRLSDRLGRRYVLIVVAAVATFCSFGFGWMVASPAFLLALVGVIYYFTALGDSPVLTTALSEAVDPGILGAVLAVRLLLGFAAGAIAPVVFGMVLDLTNSGTPILTWGWGFMALGVGGLLATACAYFYKGSEPSARP
ncbi:MAG: MFS transporter, partial [Gammaproteobacteria bacterium]|nr:MFS transporter [Gammaproteobacteria bacterium]